MNPQLRHRRAYRETEHPEVGRYRAPAPQFLFSKSDCKVERAPLLDEHNEVVLRDVLDMSDDDIEELIIDEAVEWIGSVWQVVQQRFMAPAESTLGGSVWKRNSRH